MARSPKLNRAMILHEAIALLQEGGLEVVSLRKIADRLGVQAPALARHVGDKGQLLALMSAAIFRDALDSIPPGLTGDIWLEAFGHALRRKQSETRDVSGLMLAAPALDELDAPANEYMAGLLAAAGLEGPRAQVEQSAIQALVTGWMTFEKSQRADLFAARLPTGSAFEDSLRALIAGFGAARP